MKERCDYQIQHPFYHEESAICFSDTGKRNPDMCYYNEDNVSYTLFGLGRRITNFRMFKISLEHIERMILPLKIPRIKLYYLLRIMNKIFYYLKLFCNGYIMLIWLNVIIHSGFLSLHSYMMGLFTIHYCTACFILRLHWYITYPVGQQKQHLPCTRYLALQSNVERMKTLVYMKQFLLHASSFRTLQNVKV